MGGVEGAYNPKASAKPPTSQRLRIFFEPVLNACSTSMPRNSA